MNALKTPAHLPLTLPRLLAITMILVTGVFAGCASDEGDGGMQSTATVFDGARVIVGGGLLDPRDAHLPHRSEIGRARSALASSVSSTCCHSNLSPMPRT